MVKESSTKNTKKVAKQSTKKTTNKGTKTLKGTSTKKKVDTESLTESELIKSIKNVSKTNNNVPMVYEYMPTLSKEKQIEYATMFAEGSQTLKELLLFAWQNNINTCACCKGHEPIKTELGNGKFSIINPTAYISFYVESLTKKQLTNFFTKVVILVLNQSKMIDHFNLGICYDKNQVNLIQQKCKFSLYITQDSEQSFSDIKLLIDGVIKNEKVSTFCKKYRLKGKLNKTCKNYIKAAVTMSKNLDIKKLGKKFNKSEIETNLEFGPKDILRFSVFAKEGKLGFGVHIYNEAYRKVIFDEIVKGAINKK